ncbi:serine/arginine repetitive matrix protein 1-like [Apteryx rowi]|uniref:serine/arginine repetitive matrix protein 1-like n=1 Tax=Apteryx rowi TaxID=308060 RepID=UPI000E1CD221|nr:serine/arginine repetitive matrix protein 1-like [Apteryx rowi]
MLDVGQLQQNGRGGSSSAPEDGGGVRGGGGGGGGEAERGTGPAALSLAPPARERTSRERAGETERGAAGPPAPYASLRRRDRPTDPARDAAAAPGEPLPPPPAASPRGHRRPAPGPRRRSPPERLCRLPRRRRREPAGSLLLPPDPPRERGRQADRQTDCWVSPLPPSGPRAPLPVKDSAGSSSSDPLPALAPSCGRDCWILLLRERLLDRFARVPAREAAGSSSYAPPCGLRIHQGTHTRTHPGQLQILAFVGFAATHKANLYLRHTVVQKFSWGLKVYFVLVSWSCFFFSFCFTGNQKLVLELDLPLLHFSSGLDNTEALCFSTWIVFSC